MIEGKRIDKAAENANTCGSDWVVGESEAEEDEEAKNLAVEQNG